MTPASPGESLEEFVVDRRTGTHADVFAAVGLADVLAAIIGEANVRLTETERGFTISTEVPIDSAHLSRFSIGPGYPYLRPKGAAPIPSGVIEAIDYELERERVRRYGAAQKAFREAKGRTAALTADVQQSLEEDKPRDEWRLVQVMYMLTNHVAPNAVHATLAGWTADERRRQVLQALRAFASGEPAKVGWKADSVQLFNPTAAKGYARLKPDSTNRNDKTKDQWTDSFAEWLRYRGYFRAAAPFFQGSKGEHIRVYAPIPADITLAQLAAAGREMRQSRLFGEGPKLDALAVLWLATFLVQHSDQAQTASTAGLARLGLSLMHRRPSDVVSGLAVTHYQSLGSARVVSTLAALAVPGWFPIEKPDDATDWLDILDEHRRVVQGLDASHSDEITLLVAYRRFLERRGPTAVEALVDFMGAYGQFLMRAWDAKRRVRAFRTTNFRRLLEQMTSDFASIVAEPGFQAVARAVRRATVQAQFLKANGKEVREIRYDLLPELRRARNVADPGAFVEVVADFISKYNAENARRREIRKQAPANVHTDELASFLGLVDRKGANVIGALLCAYGTCVEPRDSGPDENDDSDEGKDGNITPDASTDDTTDEGV